MYFLMYVHFYLFMYIRLHILSLGFIVVINIDFYPLVAYNTFVRFLSWLIVVSEMTRTESL